MKEGPNRVRERPPNHTRLAAIVLGGSLIGCALLAEVVVRLALPYQTPDTIREYSLPYEAAAFAGYLLKPVDRLIDIDAEKARGRKPASEPSDQSIYINGNGYRGPGFEVRKPLGITRIVVLGASSVFDVEAADSDTNREASWPHLIGKRLREAGHDGVEVINAGVPGHTSANSVARLFTQLWMYEPDIVLMYHGWNDFKFWHQLPIRPECPLISRFRAWDPDADPFTNYQGPVDRLLSHSQLYVKCRTRYYSWRLRPGAEGAVPDDGDALASEYEPHGPKQFELNMALFVTACRAVGAVPILVTQATLVAPGNSDADRARVGYAYQQLDHGGIVDAYEHSYRILRETGVRTGARVIDSVTSLNGRSEFFVDHVHTSRSGSIELARVLAAELESVLP